jgi:hypothetical protein
LEELGILIEAPIRIYVDNRSAIRLAHNPEYHARTKHIRVHYHYVRDAVADGIIEPVFVPTEAMAADGLTKPLERNKHQRFVQLLGMEDLGKSNDDSPRKEA